MTAAIALRKPRLSKAEQEAKQAARRDKPDTMLLPGLIAEQQRMLAARKVAPRTIYGSPAYTGEPLIPARPGSTDALAVPSLVDGQRTVHKAPVAYCVGRSVFTVGAA